MVLAAVFRRGQKAELFGDGEEADEQVELQGKLAELHSVWATERTGRDFAAAIWRPELGLAEVVLQKGKLLAHMGVTRGSKLYLFIEEAVYLLDRANLLLFLDQSSSNRGGRLQQQGSRQQQLLSLAEAHELMLGAGVPMERYLVFCKLLRAGYIVQRHPARWVVRPGEDLARAWTGWGKVPTMQGSEEQQQQPQHQRSEMSTSGAVQSAALPAGRAPKRRRVQPRQQCSGTWWATETQDSQVWKQPPPEVQHPAGMQQGDDQHAGDAAVSGTGAVHASTELRVSTNPWMRGMPADFLDSLPRCLVLPDKAQRGQAAYPRMTPLQALPVTELQPLAGPAGGRHLLHYDVFSSNSKFSRKAPGRAAFVVSVLPCTAPPTPYDMAAADAAARGVPVRFSTIELGDICYYGITHVDLRSILPS